VLGVTVAASTVWEILKDAGIDPAPQRTSTTWVTFLRSQAQAIVAADFFETTTLTGARPYVLAVIEHNHSPGPRPWRDRPPELGVGGPGGPEPGHGPRRRRTPGQIPDPGSGWEVPATFDAILADAGITVVLSGVRMPRMNSMMERWIQACRHELLDRTLIWNQVHLLHALRVYERHHNRHRPHRGIANARPLRPLPEPITDSATLARLRIRRHDRLGGLLHEYDHAA
jgi:putative transposase